MVIASQANSGNFPFSALSGVTGAISPDLAHSPKRSWAQRKMSGPLPVAAACWNLTST